MIAVFFVGFGFGIIAGIGATIVYAARHRRRSAGMIQLRPGRLA